MWTLGLSASTVTVKNFAAQLKLVFIPGEPTVQVYGLNFSSKDDADVFATAMIKALEVGPLALVFFFGAAS